jgi:hypothetical protein
MSDNMSSNQPGFDELAARVREALLAMLPDYGVSPDLSPDDLYLNGVNNLEERLVIYSESLTYATTRQILEQDPPSPYAGNTLGVFFVPHSFEDEHRVPGHSPAQLGQAMEAVYLKLI